MVDDSKVQGEFPMRPVLDPSGSDAASVTVVPC
jgi:hypothetical protein